MNGSEVEAGGPGASRSKEIRGYATGVPKRGKLGQIACTGAVGTGVRLVDRIGIFVDDTGVLADALDGFPSCQLSSEKALYASADEKGVFVLQVQPCEYANVSYRPVRHESHYLGYSSCWRPLN